MGLFPKSTRQRNWRIAFFTTVITAVLIAIIVPLAILIPRRKGHGKKSSVLLPLYIYPENNATWDPLLTA